MIERELEIGSLVAPKLFIDHEIDPQEDGRYRSYESTLLQWPFAPSVFAKVGLGGFVCHADISLRLVFEICFSPSIE